MREQVRELGGEGERREGEGDYHGDGGEVEEEERCLDGASQGLIDCLHANCTISRNHSAEI